MRTTMLIAAAVGAVTASASAGPTGKGAGPTPAGVHRVTRLVPVTGVDGGWSDNFDSYAVGSNLGGQGGWAVWYSGGANAPISNAQAASAPNSVAIQTASDVVQPFTIAEGQWIFKIKTYVPSTLPPGSGAYLILLNQYGGPDNWSLQIALNDTSNGGANTLPFMVESQFDNGVLPCLTDQWIEFRAEIDLDIDQVTNFYNNQMLGTPHLWTDNNFASGPGITSIAALDLYSPLASPIYFDDASLMPADTCYPDCNQSGTLTIADFGCFQAAFAAGNLYADCNSSGTLTIADFGCFQAAFAAGCP